ncbi:MAG: class I SAM-dependent DNA methyltransferase [Actinomycetota bacterium]
MDSYGDATYGDSFADVYDEWYGEASDADATVAAVAALAAEAGGPVLELGVGTGRLAIPLARRGLDVAGVDASAAMVERLLAKPAGERVRVTVGSMQGPEPAGPFGVVFVAFNTFFNLPTESAQVACMRSVAARLHAGGVFAVETVVPGDQRPGGTTLEVRTVELDRVVVVATAASDDGRTVTGHHIELAEAGIRLRPWRIRMVTPAELDAMAGGAGLRLVSEAADWSGSPFGEGSTTRVAIYRRMPP